jgi:hypothetical protein
MTENTRTKYEKVLSLKQANPVWSIKKCCEKAKISVPSFYEARKEMTESVLSPAEPKAKESLFQKILHSNLPAEDKVQVLCSL